MLIAWNGGNSPPVQRTFLIYIPRIIGGICGDMGGEKVEGGNGSLIQWFKIGDIAFIEALREFGEHDIAIRHSQGWWQSQRRSHSPRAIPFFRMAGSIRLQQVGGAFDAECAVGIAIWLLFGVEAFGDILTEVIFFDPGVDMLDIDGNDFAQPWNLGV